MIRLKFFSIVAQHWTRDVSVRVLGDYLICVPSSSSCARDE